MRFLITLILILINISVIFSQITGKVQNLKGEDLPYASIFLKKSGIGTTSNETGEYQLKFPKQFNFPFIDTLITSYIGYKDYKKPIYIKKGTRIINITLSGVVNELNEFVVKGLTYYPPEKLIKLAIKNTKKNYNNDYSLSKGFYRELVKEKDQWIVLNEAVIQLKYAPYPQKGFLSKAFRAYYNYDNLPYNMGFSSLFRHMHRFPSFIPINKDQINMVNSRFSFNFSKYGKEVSPVGGAGDLVALDKIKYRYDFFDPKLIEQYNYKLVNEEYFNGEKCYVIDFYPKKNYQRRIFQPINKKMKYPIYLGRILIAEKTFAVVKFQYQYAHHVDFSIYRGGYGIPNFLKVSVSYKKSNNQWMLNEVKTEQRKEEKIGKLKTTYTCLRSLKLDEPKKKKVIFTRDSIAFITKSIKSRNFYNKYDKLFWNTYEDSFAYPKLTKEVIKDLESTTPLEKQFLSLNIPIDSIVHPIAQEIYCQYEYHSDTIQDNYNWLRQKSNEGVMNYLKKENTYYNDVVFKLNDSIKGFYFRYNRTFKLLEENHKITKPNYFIVNNLKYRYKQAKNGNIGLYKFVNDTVDELIFDKTKAGEGKVNFWIESIQLNNKGQLAFTYTEKGDITKTLIIRNFGLENSIHEIQDVYRFLWLNDSTILYTKTDATKRSYQLRVSCLNTKTDSLIYEEKDKTFDISIKKSTSGDYIFVFAESMNEREYYYIDYNKNNIILNTITKRLSSHNYTIDHKSGSLFYAISNKTKEKYEIVQFPIDNPILNNWKTIYTTPNPIEDFYITKDYIAVQEYNKNTLELKYINKVTKKANPIAFEDKIFSFYFNKRNLDTSNIIQIDYDSPKTAYITYDIDLETENKKIVEQEVFTFDKKTYKVESISSPSSDSIQIPITLFYDEDVINDSIVGIILKSYGAYGAKYYPEFSAEDKVYVDKGFIIAYAHVRGGGELGETWYKAGKLLNKINTFEDYVLCQILNQKI